MVKCLLRWPSALTISSFFLDFGFPSVPNQLFKNFRRLIFRVICTGGHGTSLSLSLSPLSSSPPFTQKSTTLCCVRRRWASSSSFSSSSSPSSPSSKPDKKVGNDRLASVLDAVNDRKPPELRVQRNDVRSETDIINVVEQRVYRAMEEGKFENKPGKGKPLDLKTNPHADPAEETLYKILNKNGCAPEWVELNKDIRNGIVGWRFALRKAFIYKSRVDDPKWLELSEDLQLQLRVLNNKVLHYNLIVPFGRQMFGFKWDKEIDRVRAEIEADR